MFQDKTVLQIFEEVAGAYTPRVAWRAAPEVDAHLAQARVRSYVQAMWWGLCSAKHPYCT